MRHHDALFFIIILIKDLFIWVCFVSVFVLILISFFVLFFPFSNNQTPSDCDENILHVLPPPPPTPQNQSLIAHCLEVTPPPPSIMMAPQALSSGESSSASRPSSQLSQNGSSGYGSTRSQVAPFGTNGVSNRPSPASSSSSSTSEAKHFEKTKNSNKRVVWWGGGSLRGLPKRAQQEYEIGDVDGGGLVRSGVGLNPQFASLRIPNRIRHSSHGDLPAYVEEEDPGLDLAEAEVDSEAEDLNNNNNSLANQADSSPIPTPRVPKSDPSYMNMPFPLRHASSLESQVFLFYLYFFCFFLICFDKKLDRWPL